MPLTPAQIVKIRQKEAAMSDAQKRDPNVNYYEGWFFVTLKTRDEVPVLSVCTGNPSVPDDQPDAPKCLYTKVGMGVIASWKRSADIYKGVTVDVCEAMPDHFHGLIYLKPGNKKHLGNIIQGFMAGCSHAYWDTLGIAWRNMSYIKGARVPEWQDRDHTHSYRGPALFIHGYNDTEPITPEQVEIKRAYIRDQARKRLIQGDSHDCFRKYRHQHSTNWTVQRTMTAISTDRTFRYNSQRCEKAMLNILARLNHDIPSEASYQATLPSNQQAPTIGQALPPSNQQASAIGLDYIGNRQLLWVQRKLPLICHSADAARFPEQKAAVLTAAREGAVIVSAFISQKERDIKQQLMVELLPFIEITDNGFSDKYKGVGMAFYAIAEKRLLQITPWTYQYQKDGTQVSREMCLVMNELARVISGVEDGWWKG